MKNFGISILSIVITVVLLQLLFPYRFQTVATTKYDRAGKAIVGAKQVGFVQYEEIPEQLVDLVLSVEDKRFRYHPGIDFWAIGRAFWNNSNNYGPTQGASTIEQQLIKLDREQFTRAWRVKVQEQRRAINLTIHYSKQAVLLQYVNTVPFSHGIRGWHAACQSYRGKECRYLSDTELLLLLVTAQLGVNPYDSTQQDRILQRAKMLCRVGVVQNGCDILHPSVRASLHSSKQTIDPRVRAVLEKQATTAFDTTLYTRIEQILHTTASQRAQYNIRDCCIVVLNGSGDLVSMNVCSDWADVEAGKINSCLVPRQTGSASKPFLYLYVMHALGWHKETMIVDEPVQFDIGGGNLYDPKNFDLQYHGEVSLAYALGNSLNVPAIKLLHAVGVDAFLSFLRDQLAVFAPDEQVNTKTADDVGLSLALGSYEISPLGFANLRRLFVSYNTPKEYVSQAKEVLDMLSDPTNKLVSFGQDSFLNQQGRAVKTGTSRKFVDGWICGVTKTHSSSTLKERMEDRVACIWLGNYNNEPMLGPSSEVGSYLWSLVVKEIEKG